MSTQIKKVVAGVLTANPEAKPGVIFTLPDGKQFAIALGDLPPTVVTRLAVHGLSQKIGDSYAGASEAESPLAYARGAIEETIKQLLAGDWRVAAAGGGPRATLLARALARVTGKALEDSIGVVDNLTDDAKKELRANPAIKASTAAIKLEDQAAQAEKLKKVAAAGGDATGLAGLFEHLPA